MRQGLSFLLLLALCFASALAGTITLTVETPTVNQLSVYRFQIVDSPATWAQPGIVRINFPNPPYTITNGPNLSNCLETISSTYIMSCTATNSSQISFSWTSSLVTALSALAYDTINFRLTLQNPSYVDNFDISYQFIVSGSVFAQGTGKVYGLAADTLTACAITFTPSHTNTLSSMAVQITTKNNVPAGASLQMTVSGYTTGNTITAISTNSNPLLNSTAQISSAGQTYLLFSFFGSSVTGGTNLSFTANSLMTPPTTALNSFFISVTTLQTTSFINSIDTRSCSLSVSDFPLTVTVTFSSTFMVGNTLRPSISYTTPVDLILSTDTFNFVVDGTSSSYISISSTTGGYINNGSTFNVAPFSTINATGGVTYPASNMSDSFPAGGTILQSGGINIRSMINSGTRTVFLQVFRNRNSYASGRATFTVRPNSLVSALVSALSYTVSAITTYNFTFTVRNPLAAGGGVRITLPSELSMNNGACTATATSSLGSALTNSHNCVVTNNTIVFITNMFSTAFPSNTALTVTVANIQNPISARQTGTFLIQTFFGTGQLTNPVDDSSTLTGLTVTATPAVITLGNFAISRDNTRNMQFAVYTITYTVTSRFRANGYATITFPSYMTLSSSNTCRFNIRLISNLTVADQNIIPTVTTSSGNNVFTFNFSSLITSDLPANTVITISINSLRNYYSFKPVYSQLTTFASDGSGIEQSGATDVAITNTLEDTSLPVLSTTSTRINGNPTTCTYRITPPSAMAIGDVISTQLQTTGNVNTQMAFSSTPACTIAGSGSCSVDASNPRLIYTSVGSSLLASTNYVLSVNSIILSRSFDTPGRIFFRTFEKSGTILYNISSGILTPPSNTHTNVVRTVTLTINQSNGAFPSQLNQMQQFRLTVTTTNNFLAGDIIVVTIPSQYGFIGTPVTVTNTSDLTTLPGSLCTETTIFCSNNNTSGYLVRIAEKVSGTVFTNTSSFSFTISNGSYRSPQLWTDFNSEPFLVNTYSRTGQPIDAVQSGTTANATFYLACTNIANRCGTCFANGSCASCYALGSGQDPTFTYGGFYFRTSTGICVTSCSGNFYNLSNTCVQCTSPCFGCTGSGTFCTSCINTTYLYNNTCLTLCPDGFFQNTGNVCSACLSNCLTCSGANNYCTSCHNGTYLSTRLNSCVSSSQCESYQYADSITWRCTNCSASCNGCSSTSTNCIACATGYIIDTAFGSTLPGRCTNVCPTGTVNDTTNAFGGGCRCNPICRTCQTTLSNCISCTAPSLLQVNTCVSTCSPSFYVSGTSCLPCVTNCSTCSSSVCSSCISGSFLYQNVCYTSCPTFTTSAIASGVSICYSCGSGCVTCLDANRCQTCTSSMIPQQNDTHRICVFSCSTGYVKITTSTPNYCGTSCPGDTTEVNGVCTTTSSSGNGSGSGSGSGGGVTPTLTSTSSSRFIPFPYTIALVVLVIFTLTSRLAFSHTIVPAGLCAFGGIIQILAWITLIVVVAVDPNDAKTGLFVVLIAFILNLTLNIIHFILFRKYVWKDEKVQTQYKKLGKTKTGPCVTYSCIITSLILSHKFIEILFSNLFESGFFIYKVTAKKDLVPLNYIRYFSLLPSVLAVVGGGIANYNLQTSTLNSIVFIQSIDVILVTIFSAIFAFVVTVRKQEDYENNLAEKRNDIEQQLDHDMLGDNVYHLQEEENEANKRSKYRHKSTIMVDDPRQNPLGKRHTNRVGPTGQELNHTNAPLGDKEDDFNRLNLNDFSNDPNRKKNDDDIDIDNIILESDTGVNSVPPRNGLKKKGGKSDRNGKGKNSQDPQKQKIKNNIENKLTDEQIKKTKIVRDVDTIDTSQLQKQIKDKEGSESMIKEMTKNQIKKQKLQILTKNPQNLNLIPQGDRAKAGEMKNAMNILNAKKVEIGEYLQYLDIIQEQDEDINSDDYDDKKLPNRNGRGRGGKMNTGKKKGANLVSTNKKIQKKDRTARKADDLVINHNMYDDDIEPEIPDFHQTPIKGRKLSGDNYHSNEDQFNNFSSLKKNQQNRSDQNFTKKNGLNDLVLVSLESGDNYDKSLGQQFQKGNTLQQAERDQLPPSNLYSTENLNKANSLKSSVPMGRDRLIPNTLINDETQIEYLESDGGDQQTIKGELLDFNNQVSPSHFDQANMRIMNEQLSEAPTKPRLTKIKQTKIGQVQNIDDQLEDYDDFNGVYDNNELPEAKLQRYQSNQGMLDYDDIIHQRRNNQRVKELEKIYLPRQHVNRRSDHHHRNRKNISSQSYRKEDH